MSIKDFIEQVSPAIFVSKDKFAESMELWPRGIPNQRIPFDGVLDEGELIGTNETEGDGHTINRPTGTSERKSAKIEVPAAMLSKFQNEAQSTTARDKIKVADGRVWSVKRILGRDNSTFTVLVIRKHTDKRYSRSRFDG